MGDDDIIKNYQYSERYGDWDSGDVGGLRAAAHPQSKLAAASRDGQHVLYFQSPSGALEEIQYSDNTWRSSPPLSAANLEPVFGTGLSALITADGVRVFYHHKDSSIHQVVLEGGSWTGMQLLLLLFRSGCLC